MLALCLGVPAIARAWLGPADPILRHADRGLFVGEARETIAHILTRDGRRTSERWQINPARAPRLPSSFEREMLHALFGQGATGLAARLGIDRKERSMALVDGRPTQVVGAPRAAALYIDHPRAVVLRVTRGDDDLRLLRWDHTARRPMPHRLEYRRRGRWERVIALGPTATR